MIRTLQVAALLFGLAQLVHAQCEFCYAQIDNATATSITNINYPGTFLNIHVAPINDIPCDIVNGDCIEDPEEFCEWQFINSWSRGTYNGHKLENVIVKDCLTGRELLNTDYDEFVLTSGSANGQTSLICCSVLDWTWEVVLTDPNPDVILSDSRKLTCTDCQ